MASITWQFSGARHGLARRIVGLTAVLALAGSGTGLSGALAAASGGASANTSGGLIRVNQVGYAAGATKRAYLMSPVREGGARFVVQNRSGQTVFSAAVGADQGAWSAAYPHVYALDFDRVQTDGTFRIVVTGPAGGTSPSFKIEDGGELYATALRNSLIYYQTERDGPAFIPSALRTAAGHLNDAHAMTYLTPIVDQDGIFAGDLSPLGTRIDASGGWWDAGDYLKFVETTSYTVDLQLVGVRDFPGRLGSTAGSSNFTAEARFGLDWLQKMWNDRTRTLYYQVGIGEGNDNITGDHDIWRLPQVDDSFGGTDPSDKYIRNRPVFRAGALGAKISPNLAGRDAAAFALCYQVYKSTDPAYAADCLRSAEHIFDVADTSPSGDLLTVIPFDFYPETEWRDDLELGATELYLALASGGLPSGLAHNDAAFYLAKAAHWAHAYIAGPNDAADTLNLYDVSGLAHYELARAISNAGNPAALEIGRAALLADMRKQLGGAIAQSRTDPFGFGFAWDTFDTTSHGAGLAVMAAEYDSLTGRPTYAAWGDRWLSNILGANAWGLSLIVGDGSTYPNCLQHQVVNLRPWINGQPRPLLGAAVEGPNSFAAAGTVDNMKLCPADGSDFYATFNSATAVFQDNVQAYSNTEPAIDLTASSPLAFAWQSRR
jgi:endoglucanase